MTQLRLQSVGARLSLALLVVVAGALAVVYLIVIPSLEERLVNSRIQQAERVAQQVTDAWRFEVPAIPQDLAEGFASATNTRVTIFTIEDQPLSLSVQADGPTGAAVGDIAHDPLALDVAKTFTGESRVVTRADREYAEAAQAIAPGIMVLVSTPLEESLATVELVKRRILTAGVIALAAALLVGYLAASVFARRIRRLERAADRIAGGLFDEPVADTAKDELGQLARAFDRMRERLAQLERARREFIANASHELRTPLFSLGGHLELLTDEDLDEPTKHEFLVRMQEQVERLTKLAEELLDLSRLDAGHLHLERAPVDLGRVAELLLEEFEPVARSGEHALELSRNGETSALGDEQRVLQIGRALVENALRHTPPGTRVRIETARSDGQAALAVADDGPGIPPEHVPHVFERFYRSDGTLASGSGLGLAIARELAEVMEGEIDLESRPGRTVFRVWLPAVSLSE
ncbi:MAG: HAMP domain-containing protein [Actinobacteria bacterium]|nr:HAMP domain-containing protein [Actinomycetota bacterium]